MTLVLNLVRHAQSADKQLGQHDHDRVLTAAGMKQAKDLGIYFKENNFKFDKILCSPAARTKQTLNLILAELDKTMTAPIDLIDRLYHGTVDDYQLEMRKIAGTSKQVLIIGHNPSISQLCGHLAKDTVTDFEPCGFAQLGFDSLDWTNVKNASGAVQFTRR